MGLAQRTGSPLRHPEHLPPEPLSGTEARARRAEQAPLPTAVPRPVCYPGFGGLGICRHNAGMATYAEQLTAAKNQLDELLATPIEEHQNAHGARYRRRAIADLQRTIEWLESKVNEANGPAVNLADLRRKP